MIAKFEAGTLILSITLSSFLANWLRHHIKGDDLTLINYLKQHRPKGQPAVASR